MGAIGSGRSGAGGASIVTQPIGPETKPTITQRALVASRAAFFTAADLQDPARLHQVIYQQAQASQTALHALASNPLSQGNLLSGVVFTMGQTIVLSHGLGRAFTGYHCTRAQGNPWSGSEGTLPTGVTPDTSIALTSQNAGTYDFWIF